MQNRNLLINKIETLEGKMKILKNKINTSRPISEFLNEINKSEDTIEEIKTMINREPRTANEQNYLG